MPAGEFLCIVGPSGSGKDTLIDGIRAQVPDTIFFATRTITRPPGKPGEIYESVTPAIFAQREAAGDFLITWDAHGLRYALSKHLTELQQTGHHIVANGSRAIAKELHARIPNVTFIEITAPLPVLAQRILLRGRESLPEIEKRLVRAKSHLPDGLPSLTVHNDLSVALGISRFLAAVQHLCPIAPPSLAPVNRQILNLELAREEYVSVENALQEHQLTHAQQDAILVSQLQMREPKVLLALLHAKLATHKKLAATRGHPATLISPDPTRVVLQQDTDGRLSIEPAGALEANALGLANEFAICPAYWLIVTLLAQHKIHHSGRIEITIPWNEHQMVTDQTQAHVLADIAEILAKHIEVPLTVKIFNDSGSYPH